jgi:hypothetical protein
MKTTFTIAGMIAITAMLLFGCSHTENAVDCVGICDRYQTCFDSRYDTNVCVVRCRDNADSDPSYMDKVVACHACMDDRSCASVTFTCSTQCAGIVP